MLWANVFLSLVHFHLVFFMQENAQKGEAIKNDCRMEKLMNDSDSIFSKEPEYMFLFQPKKKDEKEIQFIIKQYGFRHPVFIDRENKINKLNNFPSKTEHQCFLLDKDNKVLIVGNPSLNPGIWTLYKKVITERERFK